MTAAALAGEMGLPLFTIQLDGVITKFMGETAAKLRLVFEAIRATRGVYLFDEFDAIGERRTASKLSTNPIALRLIWITLTEAWIRARRAQVTRVWRVRV